MYTVGCVETLRYSRLHTFFGLHKYSGVCTDGRAVVGGAGGQTATVLKGILWMDLRITPLYVNYGPRTIAVHSEKILCRPFMST